MTIMEDVFRTFCVPSSPLVDVAEGISVVEEDVIICGGRNKTTPELSPPSPSSSSSDVSSMFVMLYSPSPSSSSSSPLLSSLSASPGMVSSPGVQVKVLLGVCPDVETGGTPAEEGGGRLEVGW
jgi:hypothetical protein